MATSLYGAPDVLWYEPGAVSVSSSGLIAMTTGGSILFARLEDSATASESTEVKVLVSLCIFLTRYKQNAAFLDAFLLPKYIE